MSLPPVHTAPPPRLSAALDALDGSTLRPVTDEDSQGLITLVGEAFDEYPGCVLDLPGLDRDLVEPATSAAAADSRLWVVDHPEAGVIACIGLGPVDATATAELKRLYVAANRRRRGLARGLVDWVEAVALDLGASAIELWSDTRFVDAHRLYERLGYAPTGQHRELHDPSATTERHFRRELTTPGDRRN